MYAIRYKELVKKDEGINNNMAKKRDKKNKLRGKWLRGIIIVYLLLILCNLFHEFPSRLGNLHSIPVSEEWYLIVVNRWNEIPEDYRVELTELSNGQKVDSRIYPYLQEMFDAARKDGIYPVVREGYRTYEEQQKILDDSFKKDYGGDQDWKKEIIQSYYRIILSCRQRPEMWKQLTGF